MKLTLDNVMPYDIYLMLQRRDGISLDKADKNALYLRKLGDAHMRLQHESLHRQIENNLDNEDRQLLQNMSYAGLKTNFGVKYLTDCSIKHHKKLSRRNCSASLLDDSYDVHTKCLLNTSSNWSFDIFSLHNSSNGHPVVSLIMKLFQQHNLIQHFDLDIVKLRKFATMVEEGYHHNPYHNSIHAADVTQAMHCYILQNKISKHLTPLERLTSLVAAMTHDLDHPGVNQAFLIATSNHLATLYKNNAVLENHHWRTALSMIRDSGIFDHFPRQMLLQVEQQIKSLILATDMTRQQEFYSQLKKHNEDKDLNMEKQEDRHFALQIALKCADINNPCREWSVCEQWSKRVCDEFFQQGDYEKNLSLPITNLCDRTKNKIPSIQTGFIDFVVEPLFKEFERLMESSLLKEQLTNLRHNRNQWQKIVDEQATDINSNKVKMNRKISEQNKGVQLPSVHSNGQSDKDGAHTKGENELSFSGHSKLSKAIGRRHSTPARPSMRTVNFGQSLTGSQQMMHPDYYSHSTQLQLNLNGVYQKISLIEEGLTLRPTLQYALSKLLAKPRISTLCPSLEASKLSNYLLVEANVV